MIRIETSDVKTDDKIIDQLVGYNVQVQVLNLAKTEVVEFYDIEVEGSGRDANGFCTIVGYPIDDDGERTSDDDEPQEWVVDDIVIEVY